MKRSQLISFGLLLSACGGGFGDLTITTYGEDFIEQQIPVSGPEEEGVVDGYTITYTKFLVAMSDLSVEHRSGDVAATLAEQRIFDMTRPGPHSITRFKALPAQRWDDLGLAIKPAQGAATGNATEADTELMNAMGYSIYLTGHGEKSGARTEFAWGFDTHTEYRGCVDADEQAGVVIPNGGSASVEFTIHGDHFFYDDLLSESPSLRFQAFANADENSDGRVSLEELALIDLTTLSPDQYGTGGASNVDDLRAFLRALSRTLVHFQGEGHCTQRPR